MTLLGAGPVFSLGSTNGGVGDPSMGKSLEDIIKDRRKSQSKDMKSAGGAFKKLSAADRSIAEGRAKRNAATNARRGLSDTKKPSAKELQTEISRQAEMNAKEKRARERKATGGRIVPDPAARNIRKKQQQKKNDPPGAAAGIVGIKAPSRKAMQAALQGMESAGFKPPAGHQVVMTFVPVPTTAPKTTATPAASVKGGGKKTDGKGKGGGPPNKKGNNNNRGSGGSGGGGGGGRGGGGGGGRKKN